jgi:hypothetical protein
MATNGTTDTQIISGINGSGTYLPLSFYTNNALAAQIDTTGNFFGTGKMGGVGSVIQVVQGSFATQVSTSSSTYSDTGITASITPSSASNKILVFSSVLGCLKQLSNTKIGLRLVRGATTVDTFSTETGRSTDYGATAQVDVGTISSVNLDSPASTSALTYKIQFASGANTSNIQINNVSGTTIGSTITLMEIKA